MPETDTLSLKTWPAGGGEVGQRLRELEGGRSPLGPPATWPAHLKTAIELILPVDAQIAIFWGPEHVALYNDAYAPTIGNKHPAALAQPASEHWSESWQDLQPLLEGVRRSGDTLKAQDRPFQIQRHGFLEEVFFDISYSAMRDGQGHIAGVLCVVRETTDRVRSQRALAASDARLRASEAAGRSAAERIELALSAGAVLGTWVWDVANDRITGDTTFARTFSLTREALETGLPVSAVLEPIHPDDRAAVEAGIGAVLVPGGDAFRSEYRLRGPEGQWLWVEAHGHVERDTAGRPLRFPGVLIDIDARKRAQGATLQELAARRKAETDLAETHHHFRLAQEAGGIGVFSLDLAIDQLTVSAEFCRVFGLAEATTLPAGTVEALAAPEDRGRMSSPESRSAGSSALQTEYRIRRADNGELRWIARRAEFMRDAEGRTVQMFGVVQDITERKLAEATLRASEAQFRALAQALPNQVWTATADGQLDWFNDRIFEYAGLGHEDLAGERWARIVHADDLAAVARDWAHSVATGHPYESEFRIRRADGEARWHLVRALPIDGLAGDGRARRWVGTNTDTHELKRAQAELARLNVSLEERVAERTAALNTEMQDRQRAEEALRQSQKMEAVGQLTGGIAHDFNNLLQGITGSLEAIKKRIAQGRAAEVDKFVAGALASAQRAASLTHRLLAFSRRQPLDPKPVRANPLVVSMEDLLRRTLGEQISLELRLAEGLWPTLCDPNQLESALLNLVINARDAMPQGGRLTITTSNAALDDPQQAKQHHAAPGHYVCIAVTDSGTGMTPEVLQRAFDPFFTTKPIGQGTGLGLSMVYGFARQSEGQCLIDSRPGEGTSVQLYLPRYQGSVASQAEAEAEAEADSQAPGADLGEGVLVVEDERVVRGLIVEVLADLGYAAIEAADGPSGLALLQDERRIDLLVTDIGLPGMNGRQLAEAARALRPELKVLFMTGYAETAALAHGFLQPGMALITKPFEMDTLAAKIRDLIRA